MSVQSQINRISGNVTAALSAIAEKGVTVGSDANSDDLATLIASIFTGVDTSDATALAQHILAGYTAYVNGEKITGTIPSQAAQTITPGTTDQTIASGKYLSGTQTIKGDANLIAENIAKGVSIFDVVGALEAGGGTEIATGTLTVAEDTNANGIAIDTGLKRVSFFAIFKKDFTPAVTNGMLCEIANQRPDVSNSETQASVRQHTAFVYNLSGLRCYTYNDNSVFDAGTAKVNGRYYKMGSGTYYGVFEAGAEYYWVAIEKGVEFDI